MRLQHLEPLQPHELGVVLRAPQEDERQPRLPLAPPRRAEHRLRVPPQASARRRELGAQALVVKLVLEARLTRGRLGLAVCQLEGASCAVGRKQRHQRVLLARSEVQSCHRTDGVKVSGRARVAY